MAATLDTFIVMLTGDPVDTCGLSFSFDSVQPLDARRLRLWFTRAPSPATATIGSVDLVGTSGQTAPSVVSVTRSTADSDVYDVYLDSDMASGTYLVTISDAVVSETGMALLEPFEYAFNWTPVVQEPIAHGGQNSAAEEQFLANLNPAYRNKTNWRALADALSTGDALIRADAAAAFNQLYVSTASGRYLDRRAADRGIAKPTGPGLTDDVFRRLAIIVSNNKLTANSMLDALEVFYGPEATHAFVETSAAEPFHITADTTLEILVDERTPVRVNFPRAHFTTPLRAAADEVAAIITRALEIHRLKAWATAYTDPETDEVRVRIYSGTQGLTSSMRVTGGSAQPVLLFPGDLFEEPEVTPPDFGGWVISKPTTTTQRWLYAGDFFDFQDLQIGDYVVIRGIEFDEANTGSYTITDVNFEASEMWFEITNASGIEEGPILQCEYGDLQLFRARRRTTYDGGPTYAILSQARGAATASIAATTRAIQRAMLTGSYVQVADAIDGLAVTRDPLGVATVTALDHGLEADDWFDIDDLAPSTDLPVIVAGTPSGSYSGSNQATGTSAEAQITHWNADTTAAGVYMTVVRGSDDELWCIGGWTQTTSALTAEQHRVQILEVASDSVTADGTRTVGYRWNRGTDADVRAVGAAHSVISYLGHLGQILAAGGYTTQPWDIHSDTFYVTGSQRYARAAAAANVAVEATTGAPDEDTVADSCLVETTTGAKIVKFGGSKKLHVPWRTWETYDPPTDSWVAGGNLVRARAMAQGAPISATKVLVIGGRAPAVDNRSDYTMTSWMFEDAAAAVTFTGPVAVPMSGAGTRKPGKMGHGVELSSPLTASAGAPQTAVIAQLVGDYSIVGWMTRGSGTVISNSTQPWAAEASNTLVAFGIDPSDDKFFVRWQHGAGPTTLTQKTTATATSLMPVVDNDDYPRYYHFAITKENSGANATFTLYVNGVQAGQWTGTKPSGGTTGLWSFGRANAVPVGTNYGAYTGVIDAVGLTSVVTTAAQIKKSYLDELGVLYDSPTQLNSQPVGRCLSSCEVITTGGAAALTGPMGKARFAAGVCVLPDGRVLVCGGVGYNDSTAQPPATSQQENELRECEVYDPGLGYWSPVAPMRDTHSHCSAAFVAATNRVYVAGGLNSTAVEYIDLDTMTWGIAAETLPTLRLHAAAGLVGTDVLAVAGGGAGTPDETDYHWASGAVDYVAPVAAETVMAGGLTGRHRVVEVLDADTFTFETPNYVHYTAAGDGFAVTPVAAPEGEAAGPFIFEPTSGFGLTGVEGTTDTALEIGHRYQLIQLGSGEGADFPDEEGWLVFQFGYSNQVGPVRYLGNTGDDTLVLDAAYKFPATVPAGSTVTLLISKGPYIPTDVTEVGAFWATASASGRVAAEATLRDMAATGIDLTVDIRYPGDRALGGEGLPTRGVPKLSSIVEVFGGDDLDAELAADREDT